MAGGHSRRVKCRFRTNASIWCRTARRRRPLLGKDRRDTGAVERACAEARPSVLDREGRRLAVAFVEEETDDDRDLHVVGDGAPSVRLVTLAGSAQQVAWRADGEAVLAILAEPGSDSASLTSGTRRERSHMPIPS